MVELQLESTILPAITVGDKCKACTLETGVKVSSSLVAAQTAPDGSRLKRLGVAIGGVEDHQVVVVSVTFATSLSSEHSDVECDMTSGLIFDLDVPSALTAGAIKSWVVLGLNLHTSRVHGQCVRPVAHEECGLEGVRETEALLLASIIASEADVDLGWVGKLEGSSHSAEAVASAGFRVDNESVSAVGVHSLNGDLDVSLVVRVAELPATFLVGGISRWVVL